MKRLSSLLSLLLVLSLPWAPLSALTTGDCPMHSGKPAHGGMAGHDAACCPHDAAAHKADCAAPDATGCNACKFCAGAGALALAESSVRTRWLDRYGSRLLDPYRSGLSPHDSWRPPTPL